jgi:hypothetical protein
MCAWRKGVIKAQEVFPGLTGPGGGAVRLDVVLFAALTLRLGGGGGRTDSRITLEHATDDAGLIGDTLLTRLGEVLLGRERLGTQEKVDIPVRFATVQGRAPKRDDRMDGVNIGKFLVSISGNL